MIPTSHLWASMSTLHIQRKCNWVLNRYKKQRRGVFFFFFKEYAFVSSFPHLPARYLTRQRRTLWHWKLYYSFHIMDLLIIKSFTFIVTVQTEVHFYQKKTEVQVKPLWLQQLGNRYCIIHTWILLYWNDLQVQDGGNAFRNMYSSKLFESSVYDFVCFGSRRNCGIQSLHQTSYCWRKYQITLL